MPCDICRLARRHLRASSSQLELPSCKSVSRMLCATAQEVEDMLHAAIRDAVPAQLQPQRITAAAAASGNSSGGYTSEDEDLAAFSDEDEG